MFRQLFQGLIFTAITVLAGVGSAFALQADEASLGKLSALWSEVAADPQSSSGGFGHEPGLRQRPDLFGAALKPSQFPVQIAESVIAHSAAGAGLSSVGGTADEPSGQVFLPTNPALSCPGFYVIRTHPGSNSQPGRFGAEILLRGSGSRTLQGGINFGGRAIAGINGFSAFSIANRANEQQRVDLTVTVGAPGRIRLERRSSSQGNTMFINQAISTGTTSVGAVVPPGFYVVSFETSATSSVSYGISALTSYTNRPGGGFQGGAVFGGYHDPARATGGSQSTGFAGICLGQPYEVSVEVLARPTYGSTGARGMAFSISTSDGLVFLDSRSAADPDTATLTSAINRIAGWPGLLYVGFMDIAPASRAAFRNAYEIDQQDLDILLDSFLIQALARVDSNTQRAMAAVLDVTEEFPGEVLVNAQGRIFVLLDVNAIDRIPGGTEVLDEFFLELEELGLFDLRDAILAGRYIRLTGFESQVESSRLVPDRSSMTRISAILSNFVTNDAQLSRIAQDGQLQRFRALTTQGAVERLQEQLAAELGLGNVLIDDDFGNGNLNDNAVVDFWVRDGDLIQFAVDIGVSDDELNVPAGTVWSVFVLEPFDDAIQMPTSSFLFDLCRLPEDLFEC